MTPVYNNYTLRAVSSAFTDFYVCARLFGNLLAILLEKRLPVDGFAGFREFTLVTRIKQDNGKMAYIHNYNS